MIYITLLLFAALVYSRHRRNQQRWERIKRDAARCAMNRKFTRVRLAILTNKETNETFELFDDNRDDERLKNGDWTISYCNQCDPANHFERDAARWG